MTRVRSALLRAGTLGASLAFAQAAPAASEIALAHVAPLSGPVTREATEYNAGIRLALKADTALVRFREAAASDALAALMTVGSPAMARLLAEQFPETQKLPVIGVIPGAEPLRTPLNPYAYHLRAGDLEQYRKLAEHAATTGQ
jgi:branched-chain amino acid transport system substrate-binding protein